MRLVESAPMNLLQKAPWLERGQFSPYKSAVLALLCLPGLWVAYELKYGMLGPRPANVGSRYEAAVSP